MPTTIILTRHGQTVWNAEGRYQGQSDVALSEKGLQQADKLAEGLRHMKIDLAMTSPLQRASITCEKVMAYHNAPLYRDDRLMEMNRGCWQGMLATDIAKKYPEDWKVWVENPYKLVARGNGETVQEVRERIHAAFDDYLLRYPNKTILVCAHGTVNCTIICDILGMDTERISEIHQDNCCINIFEHDGERWTAKVVNATAHMGNCYEPTHSLIK